MKHARSYNYNYKNIRNNKSVNVVEQYYIVGQRCIESVQINEDKAGGGRDYFYNVQWACYYM